ncbi:hypothetical protein ACS0TY_007001 [Phlomoides rotata]
MLAGVNQRCNFLYFSNVRGKIGEKLYKFLCGKRYLIILDEVWSTEIWDSIKCFFPNNNEKHGIVVKIKDECVSFVPH